VIPHTSPGDPVFGPVLVPTGLCLLRELLHPPTRDVFP
jgi:hypothetical protein